MRLGGSAHPVEHLHVNGLSDDASWSMMTPAQKYVGCIGNRICSVQFLIDNDVFSW